METKDQKKPAFIAVGNGHKAIVDLEDLPRVSLLRWFTEKRHAHTYYASVKCKKDGVRKKSTCTTTLWENHLRARKSTILTGTDSITGKRTCDFAHIETTARPAERGKQRPRCIKGYHGVKAENDGEPESLVLTVP